MYIKNSKSGFYFQCDKIRPQNLKKSLYLVNKQTLINPKPDVKYLLN